MKVVKKTALILASVLVGAYLLNLLMWLCLYDPANDYARHRMETTSLEYLSELLGRGTEIQIKDIQHKGFGLYHQSVRLNKRQLVKIDISGDTKNLGIYNSPYLHVCESLTVKYFNNSISVKIKNPVSEKYNDAKLTYPQTGLKDLFTTNKIFSVAEDSAIIIANATNCTGIGAFEGGSLLFSCRRPLTLKNAVEYNNELWDPTLTLQTQAFAVKTGETEDSAVIYLRVHPQKSKTYYSERLNEMLVHLISNPETTKKFLNTSLFGNINVNFQEIKDYIDKNGIQIIGYNLVDSPLCDDSIFSYIFQRESDGVSKLVQLNNGIPVFI